MQATEKQITKIGFIISNFDYELKEKWAMQAFIYQLSQKEDSREKLSKIISVGLDSQADEFKFFLKLQGYESPLPDLS